MKNFTRSIIISFMLINLSVNGFIYDIRVMRKWDRKDKYYSYFIGLGDFHDKTHKITSQQVRELDAIMGKCKKDRTKVVVEDVSSAGCGGRKCCGRFFINSSGGILGGLAKKYRDKGFRFLENVEYRYCRVASLAPVVNNIHANLRKFASTSGIFIKNFEQEVQRVLKDVSRFNDGKMLNNWYKTCISTIENDLKRLKLRQMSKMSVADYLYYNTNPTNRLGLVKKLLTFDSSLVDAKIVHSIINSPKKQNSIVIAGGSHIRNVSNILQTIGYKPIYNSRVIVRKERVSNPCLGSHIAPGGFCAKPLPANLKVLHNFL